MNIQNQKELAATIDHTLIIATATGSDVKRVCNEALEYGFRTVTVNPRWVPLAADILHGSPVRVGSVAGFPLGADATEIKIRQAKNVIMAGADEVDMVADLAAIFEGDEKYLRNEIAPVLKICRTMRPNVILKVIIESAALTVEQKIFVCGICDALGVDFIKTSTGLLPAGGATVEDVKLMRQSAPRCKIKAAGGIRTVKDALDMIAAGAERLGTSSAVQIIEQFKAGQTQ